MVDNYPTKKPATIIFEDIPLAEFGNRIPDIKIVIDMRWWKRLGRWIRRLWTPTYIEDEDIEVTPEMLKAGVHMLECMDSRLETDEEVVKDIFDAMIEAKNEEDCSAGCERPQSMDSTLRTQ